MHRFIVILLASLVGAFSNISVFSYEACNKEPCVKKIISQNIDEEYFFSGVKLFQEKNYRKALSRFLRLTNDFKESNYYAKATFLCGQIYFSLHQYDLANKFLSDYLKTEPSLETFNATLYLKYNIAKQYAQGYRKHIQGVSWLPRLEDSSWDAYDIYDEVYSMISNKEIAVQALFEKALLLKKNKNIDDALQHFQDLTKQFPDHPLCLEAYVEISKIYLQKSLAESHNTTYLSLAFINQEQVMTAFPASDEISLIQNNIMKMQEHYALNLFNTGIFYQKKNKPEASKIYFAIILQNYSETKIAQKSFKKLQKILSTK